MEYVKKTSRLGFTLTELLVAIAILGVLGAVVVPALWNYYKGAQKTATIQSIKALKQSINMYKIHTNKYPGRLRDLVKKPRDPEVAAKWMEGGYLKKEPKDGWGNSFVYKPVRDGNNPYTLYSYGSNGRGAPKKEWINAWNV